jgi:hypothetical protein
MIMTRATTFTILLIVLLTSVLLVYAAGSQTAYFPQVYSDRVEPSPTPEEGYTWTYIFYADVQGSKLGIWGAKPGYCYEVVVNGGQTVNIVSVRDMDCNQDDYNPAAPWPPPEYPPPPPNSEPEFGQYEIFTVVMNKGAKWVCGTLNCVGVKR